MISSGLPILTAARLVVRVPFPRSPARARRRARLGHPQHMADRPDPKIYRLADPFTGRHTLMMHPATYARFRQEFPRR